MPRSLALGLFALIAVATVGLYLPSLTGQLVYDDLPLIEAAPATQSIGAALERFMEPFWAFSQPDASLQRGVWRPMTSLALAVGRSLQGGDPLGFHLVSLLLHVASAIMVFRLTVAVLRRRLKAASGTRLAIGGAAAALLFAFHPAQVESVAWISAVNDPLWGFFGLWSLLRYEEARARGKLPWGSALLMLVALACKEQALVLPLIALALDWTAARPDGRSRPTRGALTCLTLAVAAWYALRVVVFGSADAGLFRESGDFGFTTMRALGFRIELGGGFMENLLWPVAPAVFRPVHPVLPEGSQAVLMGGLWLGGTVLAALLAFLKGWRTLAFGLAAALIVIAPFVVSPDKAGLFPESDRYLYVAVFGAALGLVAVLLRIGSTVPLIAVSLAALGLFGQKSWAHQDRFANELAFRDAAVQDAPDSPNVRWGAGRAYITEYQRTQDVDLLARAYLHYLHSLKAVTVYGDGSFVDDETKPLAERVSRLEYLILETPREQRRLDPTVFATIDDRFQATLGQIYSNLLRADVSENADLEYPLQIAESAKALYGAERPELNSLIAQIHMRRGELQKAKDALAIAIQRAPSNVGYLRMLGDVLMREGDFDGARATFKRILERTPDDLELRLDFATAAMESNQLELAEAAIQEVLQTGGAKSVRANVLRATLETRRGRPSEALRFLDRALEIDPNSGLAHKQRGVAMVQIDDMEGALDGFMNAARLLPEDFESHYNVASLLLRQQPAPDASASAHESWLMALQPVLLRAYMLSSPSGDEQLLLQQQLEILVGDDPDRCLKLATQLKLQGRSPLSLIWVNRAVRNRGKWPEEERDENLVLAYTLQGRLSIEAGLLDDAVNALRNAVLIDPNHFPAQFELSDLLVRLQRYGEAETPTRKALELFDGAGIAEEMAFAVKGTLEQHLSAIQGSKGMGPMLPK